MSKSKTVNVVVTLEQCDGDVAKLIKRFSKKVKNARVLEKCRDLKQYTKPSQENARKKRNKIRLSKQVCSNCGQTGHKRKECRQDNRR